jgi:hypothetical protein
MRVHNVIIWPNGMLMVFDEHGQQIPALQGRITDYEVFKNLALAMDPETKIEFGDWPEHADK